ncbi:hypothetical protein N752_18905 [Desulforamulus aquiferis]|nr:hypothetical protein [Desulforamulus aquiferis]RYD03479.1 hypothetical protein N752_18905 [Desulforamulus aquiferis]
MMTLSRQPGFKKQMEETMDFLRQIQQAAEAIAVQMEVVQTEFKKIKADEQIIEAVPRQTNQHGNPFLQHLFRLMG